MKKVLLILVASLFCTFGYSQKKKPVAKKGPVAANIVVAKIDNVSAEVAKDNFYLFFTVKTRKDTIRIKNVDPKKLPANGKIIPFTAKGTPLYAVSWTETSVTETKLKKEEAVTTFTDVYDIHSKARILENAQTTTSISEIVYLDAKQTVSETQQKLRKEGFEFSLAPTGDIVLKNKAQENKLTYDAAEKKFVNAAPVKAAAKKK